MLGILLGKTFCSGDFHTGMSRSMLIFIAAAWYSTVWRSQNNFNQFPMNGHLSCFKFYTTVNNVGVSIFLHASFSTIVSISILQNKLLEVEYCVRRYVKFWFSSVLPSWHPKSLHQFTLQCQCVGVPLPSELVGILIHKMVPQMVFWFVILYLWVRLSIKSRALPILENPSPANAVRSEHLTLQECHFFS